MEDYLSDMQGQASILDGLIEAIDHLDNDGHHNAMTTVIRVAGERATALNNALDSVNRPKQLKLISDTVSSFRSFREKVPSIHVTKVTFVSRQK